MCRIACVVNSEWCANSSVAVNSPNASTNHSSIWSDSTVQLFNPPLRQTKGHTFVLISAGMCHRVCAAEKWARGRVEHKHRVLTDTPHCFAQGLSFPTSLRGSVTLALSTDKKSTCSQGATSPQGSLSLDARAMVSRGPLSLSLSLYWSPWR